MARAALAWVLVIVATFLLISMGGAIVAAPVTVPLLVLAARTSTGRGYRIWAGIVVVLTIAEVVWALTYFAFGEARPAIWLVPALAVVGVSYVYARLSQPSSI